MKGIITALALGFVVALGFAGSTTPASAAGVAGAAATLVPAQPSAADKVHYRKRRHYHYRYKYPRYRSYYGYPRRYYYYKRHYRPYYYKRHHYHHRRYYRH